MKRFLIKGLTTKYGFVKAARNGKFRLLLETEAPIKLTAKEGVDLREYVGKRVCIHGMATWRTMALITTDLVVEEINEFTPAPIDEAFALLKEKLGPHFDKMDDPNEHLMLND